MDSSENQNDPECKRAEVIASLIGHVRQARIDGKALDQSALIEAHPELMPELGREFQKYNRVDAARMAAQVEFEGQKAKHGSSMGRKRPRVEVAGYTILQELGRGGQAVVYLAVQLSTGRTVAVKVLLEGPLADEKALSRFDREVEILATLNHPNIVTIFDTGTTQDGSRYIAMKYIDGCGLDEFMKHNQKEDRDDPSTLLRLFLKICDAVNAAHQLKIVHRDLKPGNIRIDERDEPQVLDFGLARSVMDGLVISSEHMVSVTGDLLGSLPWCSPEQAEGDPDKIDIRSDVYSLGVILYQILTGGRFPYKVVGNIRDILNNILTAEPTPPSKMIASHESGGSLFPHVSKRSHSLINETIETIVLKALAKNRDDRYSSAGELGIDVARYLSGRPTVATEAKGTPPSHWTIALQKRRAVILILFMVVFGAYSAWAWRIGRVPKDLHSQTVSPNVAITKSTYSPAASAPLDNQPPTSGKLFAGHEGRVNAVLLLPESNLLITGGNSLLRERHGNTFINNPGSDNSIRLWNLNTTHQTSIIKDGLGERQTWPVQGLALSPDRTRLAVTTDRGGADWCAPTVTVWRLDTQKRLHHFSLTGRPGAWAPWFSNDGHTLFQFRSDTSVQEFDLIAGKEVHVTQLDPSATETTMRCACMSSDRKLVFAGMGDGIIRLWSLSGGKPLKEFIGHNDAVRALALTPDDMYLASAGQDGTARVWEVATAREVGICRPGGHLRAIAFVGGSDRIVTGGDDNLACLWNAKDGTELKRFAGHTDVITCLSVSPDGRLLATGSADLTARVWELPEPTAISIKPIGTGSPK